MAKLVVVCNDIQKAKSSKFPYLMREVLGIPEEDYELVEFSNRGINIEKITKKQRSDFMEYLDSVASVNSNYVLALGTDACKLLTSATLNSKNRGAVVQAKEAQFYVVPTYHFNYINSKPSSVNTWAKDILRCYNLENDLPDESLPTKMVYCDNIALVDELIRHIHTTKMAYFDFETPAVDKDKGTFKEGHYATTLSISFQEGSGWVIPLEHKDSPFDRSEVLGILDLLKEKVFQNPDIRKAAHNLNYDAHILRIYGIGLRGRLDDSMLMHHLYDETQRHGLKELVDTYYPEFSGYEEAMKGIKWEERPIVMLSQYNACDTDLGLRLLRAMEYFLMEDEPVYRIYRNITMPAFRALFNAESEGMSINVKYLESAIKEVKKLLRRQKHRLNTHEIVAEYIADKEERLKKAKLEELNTKLKARVVKSEEMAIDKGTKKWQRKNEGEPTDADLLQFIKDEYVTTKTEGTIKDQIAEITIGSTPVYPGFNYGSWQQLQDLLYDSELGFKFSSIDKSTGEDVLKELNDRSGFVEQLLAYRKLGKTLSTYLEGIHKRMDPNGRIHSHFKLHGTVSGRLSSANPNLQNMPNVYKLKDETLIKAVGMVKKSFNVPEGHTLYQYDYSQAELRTIAWFAKEKTMLGVYARGEDLHATTASQMVDKTLDQFYACEPGFQKENRQKAKAVNFGLIYGMEAEGFKNYAKTDYNLILTLDEAIATRTKFFDTYPKLLSYHSIYKAKASKFGWVRTFYGRRRRTPNINDPDSYIASMDERAAINSPIQGTSGEFMIFSIALLQHRLDPRIKFVNTIHDSVLFYVPDDLQDEANEMIKNTMENLPNMQYFGREMKGVSMKVDAECSKESWKDLKELKL